MHKQDLIEQLNDAIYEMKDELLDARYPEDMLFEIVDGCIPIYNSDLLTLVGNCHEFAYVDDEGLLPEKADIFKIIQTSVYEFLISLANDIFEEMKDAAEEEEEEEAEEMVI